MGCAVMVPTAQYVLTHTANTNFVIKIKPTIWRRTKNTMAGRFEF
jgi:hypothetical protein